MSCLAAVYRFDGAPVAEAVVDAMLRAMAHRCLDGAGRWAEQSVGLGQGLVRTTDDRPAGPRPVVGAGGALVLAADARLDNRPELLAALGPACAGAQPSDGQLLLAAYERWGGECLSRIVGDFAVAVWDGRKQQLWCARDPLGVRPLYVCHRPGWGVAVSTEIKALLTLPELEVRVDEARVADYVADVLRTATGTFYHGIQRLPPGHVLVARAGQATTARYWRPDPEAELRLGSDEAYAEAFRERFEAAVQCRVTGVERVGIALSGGIDSASVACVARRRAPEAHLSAFSVLWDDVEGGDERPYLRAVAQRCGLDVQTVVADAVDPFADLDALLRQHDEPIENPYFTVGWQLLKLMRSSDVRVSLDGADGDVALSYAPFYLTDLARSLRWVRLVREARGYARHQYGGSVSAWRLLRTWAVEPLLPGPGAERRSRVPTARQFHWSCLTEPLVAASTEATNRSAAAFGVEPRHPYFDTRLVELCLALPTDQKVRDGWNRAVVRRALADVLPDVVRRRGTKWHPGNHFARHLLRRGLPTLREELGDGESALRPYVSPAVLEATYRRFTAEPRVDDASTLWRLAVLARWLRQLSSHAATPRAAARAPAPAA